jgi:hypothetical protein
MRVPILLLLLGQLFKKAATDYVLYANQPRTFVILVKDDALPKVLIHVCAVMMGLHLQGTQMNRL